MPPTALTSRLQSIGQDRLLAHYRRAAPEQQKKLHAQIEAMELDVIADLVRQHVIQKRPTPLPTHIQPIKPYPRQPDSALRPMYAEAEARGWSMLRTGKIGAFLVAGGQGTRLGYDGPKGEFAVTPIKRKPLFQVFAEQLLAYSRDAGKPVPWYIMTSDANDQATRDFFQKNNYWGYNPADVRFFQQGMLPAFSMDGQILLGAPDSLALSPDGHGGSLRALYKSGALADMQRRGVEHLSYFQVDNPLVYCIDPLFLGLHDLTGSEMSSKTIPKAAPLEKVGNFVLGDGVMQVIEYSDLPNDLAHATNPDGSHKFDAGSIAIHALRVSFVDRLNAGGSLSLPWHRAEKKVPFINDAGDLVKPETPNAVKLEQFVFDAIPLAKAAMVYTTERAEEFSPVKNADGVDSPATARRDQIRRAARWLRWAGIPIPETSGDPAATLEISPLFATTPRQLKDRRPPLPPIAPGATVYLGPDGPEVT